MYVLPAPIIKIINLEQAMNVQPEYTLSVRVH